ncbi:MAG: tRNA (N(6)-L-threonylcarbamoyladenosine(37)-C(2))-methylthiotransferase MtaB [Clostridium sp.]|jgi:threonylcarbamoyladenosine tRNA methylthiotransferase MtaB|nr:tRNA (N(6)-L-threonylcarbamoyladenosine(37)-C(2))-methylthiotransferase MtaB [Clostridium sp.]
MKKTVSFYTLGCKVNQYETNAMEQQFIKNNYEIVENTQKADIYIINTCTVTNMAERKSRQMLRRVKEINPSAVLVVCGCYAQVAKNELEQIPEIDIILGINEKNEIVQIVENYMEKMAEKDKRSQEAEIDDVSKQKEFLDFGDVTYTEKNRAVVKVQDGCNMFCSYCIIPYARGRIRSRKIESVVSEIEKIANEDIKEVVITGIHVASYGKDFDNENTSKKIRLIDLLEAINKIDGIDRIRLSSLEPTIVDEEFATRLSKLDKICDHFHLSLQSGCDETLKRMNRKYTTQIYRDAVATLRKYYPEASFTTDVIVGFPGETDEEFAKTYEFLKEIDFYRLHVFKYSPRRGTVAEKMPNQIDGNKKEERSNKLIELSNSTENKHNQSYIGKTVKVLFEEFEDGFFKGHTTNYMMVKVAGEEEQSDKFVNKILDVKIKENNDETRELIGNLS